MSTPPTGEAISGAGATAAQAPAAASAVAAGGMDVVEGKVAAAESDAPVLPAMGIE